MKNSFFATLTVAAALAAVATPSFAQVKLITFNLEPNPKFLNCIKASSNGPAPKAEVTVLRGKLNDTLVLRLKDFKPNLAFDLFTVQNSNLRSDGTVDPAFLNFGMAWYQSDVQVDNDAKGRCPSKPSFSTRFSALTHLPRFHRPTPSTWVSGSTIRRTRPPAALTSPSLRRSMASTAPVRWQ